jgi:hypothetical protein
MTHIEKITTLARQYCIDNIRYWTDFYKEGKDINGFPYDYSKHDYSVFPRYQTSDAILKGIETIVGKEFSNIDECKEKLKELGLISQSHFTTGKLNGLQCKAIEDSRQKFIDFIDQVTIEQLDKVESLPYRRRFLEKEANEIREKLNKVWNFDGGYWEPLTVCSPLPFTFFDKENLTENDFNKIKEIILNWRDDRILEISEQRLDYEIDKVEFDPDCYEIIFVPKNFEWIYYGSHEGTIAFGGDWLLKEIDIKLNDKVDFKNKW